MFLAALANLGGHGSLEQQALLTLEEYFCCIYGSKKKSADIAWADMFCGKKICLKTKWLIYQICHHVLVHCFCICSMQIMSQGLASLLYVLLCPYLISLIMGEMKVVESNGYSSHFLMPSLNCWCLIMTLMMIQKILFRTVAVISTVIVKEMKVRTRSKLFFPNMCCNVLVYEKMMSFCKTILIT